MPRGIYERKPKVVEVVKPVKKAKLANSNYDAILAGATFVIEKGVSLPKDIKMGRVLYPFAFMKVGESFVIKNVDKDVKGIQAKKAAVHSAASHYKNTHKVDNFKIVSAKMDDGLRVWRVK